MSESKRFKRDHTLLEQLPNELFVEIFGYLNGVDTVYAFSQLNNRFHSLTINHANAFDFKSTSKAKFDCITKICDIHLWRSLCLSEDDETPGQIRLFCQLFPPQQYISQLQSLCALSMKPKYAQEFVSQLGSFDHLVSLTIGTICGKNIQPFELPSLKRLVITACKHTDWMRNFHHVESLEYSINYNICSGQYVLILPRTLKRLKLFYEEERDGNAVRTALRQLSQLTKLILYDNRCQSTMPNGRQWEDLIQSSLSLLKSFQFCFSFHTHHSTLNNIKQAVASFSTPFYLLKNRWFIRCNFYIRDVTKGILYSLPFAVDKMPINIHSFDMSMSSFIASGTDDDAKFDSYKKVKTVLFNERCQVPCRGLVASNIDRLVLKWHLPTGWHSLLIDLRHLELNRTFSVSPSNFAQLLACTPQLESLVSPILVLQQITDNFTNNAVCDQLSERIQSLIIGEKYYDNLLDIVSVRFLSSLVHIFGKTCKHLSLGLAAHPNMVLPILQRMGQLRSLRIHFYPSYGRSNTTVTSWLEQTSTEINASDFRYTVDDYNFFIWFENRP